MAEGYARARPPLHARIVERCVALLGRRTRVRVAVDLGCGAGLSTRPLLGAADVVIGLDPSAEMLALARTVARGARFVSGVAEAQPFRSASVDLMTAAGSLNYSEPAAALREAARVLAPEGALCVYDFSQGRSFHASPALEIWFAEFERRYPMPVTEALALDPETLAGMHAGLQAVASERFTLVQPMAVPAYADCVMTETNIAAAVRRGAVEAEIREWVRGSLEAVFGGDVREVLFPAYIVCLRGRSR
jgi:SAM-dependent methyltransferase